MNTKNKIIIDRLIGVLIALPLNYLVRFVGFFTRFDHSLSEEKRRIIISKYKGMGSIIQCTPLIKTLKIKYPNAQIVFVSSVENKMILEKIDLIDEIILLDDKTVFKLVGSSFGLIWRLLKKRGDLFIDLEIYSNFSSVITTLSIAKDRFGFYLNTSKYRLGLYTHMMYFNTTAPITQAYLQFARLLNCEEIVTSQYDFKNIETSNLIDGEYIVINVNASDLRLERRWSPESFVQLISAIRNEFPLIKVVLIGSKNEVDYVGQISKTFAEDKYVNDVSGKTSINDLIGCIKGSMFVITNDTGPMHLSSAVRKRTIALFGPCSPSQYAVGEFVIPIYKNLYCSPCVHEFLIPPCKGNNQCMQLIQVNEVLKEVRKAVQFENEIVSLNTKTYLGENSTVLGKVVRG